MAFMSSTHVLLPDMINYATVGSMKTSLAKRQKAKKWRDKNPTYIRDYMRTYLPAYRARKKQEKLASLDNMAMHMRSL